MGAVIYSLKLPQFYLQTLGLDFVLILKMRIWVFSMFFIKSFAVKIFFSKLSLKLSSLNLFTQNVNVDYCQINIFYQQYHINLISQTIFIPMHNSCDFFCLPSSSPLLYFVTQFIYSRRGDMALNVFFTFVAVVLIQNVVSAKTYLRNQLCY